MTHKVIFDVAQGGANLGQITIGLFGKIAPKTVRNFATLANPGGFQGLSYQGSRFHRVIRNFMIQGGDVVNGDGTGSISIYGPQVGSGRGRNWHSSAFFMCSSLRTRPLSCDTPNRACCQW